MRYFRTSRGLWTAAASGQSTPQGSPRPSGGSSQATSSLRERDRSTSAFPVGANVRSRPIADVTSRRGTLTIPDSSVTLLPTRRFK